jgi:hypothetical protein
MNRLTITPSPLSSGLFILAICIQYDTNNGALPTFAQDFTLWLANPKYLRTSQNVLSHLFGLQITHMNSGRRRPFSFPPSLVSIWSLQVSPSAAPRQACVASRPSSEPTVAGPILLPKNEAAGDVKICHRNKNPDFSAPFCNRRLKGNRWWWPKSIRLMKRPSGKRSRLPLFIGCSPATGGVRSRSIAQWTTIERNRHEPFGQMFHLPLSPRPSSCPLANFVSKPSRFHPCRSHRCSYGGYC